jgi:hypothetical protein
MDFLKRSLKELYFWISISLAIVFIITIFVLKGSTIDFNQYQWLIALLVTGILNIILTSITNSKDKTKYKLEMKEKRYLLNYDLREKRCQRKMDNIEKFIAKLNDYKVDFVYFENCASSITFFEFQKSTVNLLKKTEVILHEYNLEIAFDDELESFYQKASDLYHSTLITGFLHPYTTVEQIQKIYNETLKKSVQNMIEMLRKCTKRAIEKYHELESKSIE